MEINLPDKLGFGGVCRTCDHVWRRVVGVGGIARVDFLLVEVRGRRRPCDG